MEQGNRKKTSGIPGESNDLFSNNVSFNEAIAETEEIFIEVKEFESFVRKAESDSDWERAMGSYSGYPRIHRYSKNHLPGENSNCSNALCFNGGISIASIVKTMINKKEKFNEGKEHCSGYEGSPKGKHKYRDCSHQFEYKVAIKYHCNV